MDEDDLASLFAPPQQHSHQPDFNVLFAALPPHVQTQVQFSAKLLAENIIDYPQFIARISASTGMPHNQVAAINFNFASEQSILPNVNQHQQHGFADQQINHMDVTNHRQVDSNHRQSQRGINHNQQQNQMMYTANQQQTHIKVNQHQNHTNINYSNLQQNQMHTNHQQMGMNHNIQQQNHMKINHPSQQLHNQSNLIHQQTQKHALPQSNFQNQMHVNAQPNLSQINQPNLNQLNQPNLNQSNQNLKPQRLQVSPQLSHNQLQPIKDKLQIPGSTPVRKNKQLGSSNASSASSGAVATEVDVNRLDLDGMMDVTNYGGVDLKVFFENNSRRKSTPWEI